MMKKCLAFLSRIPFGGERVVCRLFSAWLSVAAIAAFGAGNFTDLSFGQGIPVFVILLGTVGFFLLLSVAGALIQKVHTDSWWMLLAASVCVIKWLSDYGAPTAAFGLTYEKDVKSFLFVAAVIFSYCLVLLYFIGRNTGLLEKIKLNSRVTLILALCFAVFGGTVISIITCLRYRTFSSPNFDFGLFCQAFHYLKTTGLPLVTCERDVLLSHFAVHFSPIFYLLLPFYALFSSPMTLQIGQAVICFCGIIPVFLLCRQHGIGNKSTLVICFLYSLYPALSCGCLYDFHENCFLAPLLLWMFLFYDRRKWLPTYLFSFGVLMVKEDAAVYLVIFAVYAILAEKNFLHGTILGALGLGWFAVVTAILNQSAAYWADYYRALGETANPAISGVMVNRFGNLIDGDAGLFGAVKTVLTNPGYVLTQLFNTSSGGIGKVVYLVQMLLCLGMMPFVAKKATRWLLAAPLLMNLLTMYQYQYNIGFQYSFAITAFLFYAMIRNVAEMKPVRRRTLLAVGAAACLCFYLVTVLPSLRTYTARWKSGKETYTHVAQVLDTLPKDASLNVSSPLVAYLSDHDVVYEIAYHGDEADVDYVVYYASYRKQDSVNRYLDAGYTVWQDIPGELLILVRNE